MIIKDKTWVSGGWIGKDVTARELIDWIQQNNLEDYQMQIRLDFCADYDYIHFIEHRWLITASPYEGQNTILFHIDETDVDELLEEQNGVT